MSDDLASAVERMSEAVECECDGERSSRFIADLRLILSALKEAGEALEIISGQRQCIDNLLSNQDVARLVHEKLRG